jgi:signal transduction histidine kinase
MADRVKVAEPVSPAGLLSGLTDKLQELESAVLRQAERFSAVLEIATLLSSVRDLDALLRTVMDRLSSLLQAEAATLFMLDAEKQELWSRVLRGGGQLDEIRLPLGTGIAGHVMATGQSLLLGDAYTDSHFHPNIDRMSGFVTKSMIAVPLKHVSGRILGVVEVLNRKTNVFSAEDLALVEAVATQIAAVLDNVLLYEELRAQNEALRKAKSDLSNALKDLDLLFETEKAVASADKQSDLVDVLLSRVAPTLGATAAAIFLVDPGESHGALYFKNVVGENAESLVTVKLKPAQGIVGHVARTGQTVRVSRAADHPAHDPSIPARLDVRADAVLSVPITVDEGVVGALALLNKPSGFTESDERLATLIAGQAGRSIKVRRNRDEAEQRERLAAIGQMLSGVVHDFRTPLTVISGYTELMATEPDEQQRLQYAAVVDKQFEHLNAMMRETLAFARGERELLIRKVYLQKFASETEAYLRQEFKKSPVRLSVVPRYTGPARFDEGKLRRVVFNMARNAVEAMPTGGHFLFSIDREADDLVLRFEDDGPGLPPEIADRVFDPFATAGRPEGTGLGLSIVKQIADEHGGTVRVESEPGKGTRFEFKIPVGLAA